MGYQMEFIAELGSNWYGNTKSEARENIARSIREAAWAGATIFKVQLFRADELYAKSRQRLDAEDNSRLAHIHESLLDFELSKDLFCEASNRAHEAGMKFWASFFSLELLDKYQSLVDGIKIASGDLDFYSLLEKAGKSRKEVCLSTGAGLWGEIKSSSNLLASYQPHILMHCVSAYPAKPEDMNLLTLKSLAKLPKVKAIGLSDHTLDNKSGVLAVALGATYFEKHFRPTTAHQNPDYGTSITQEKFHEYVISIKETKEILGLSKESQDFVLPETERAERIWARRGTDSLRPRK